MRVETLGDGDPEVAIVGGIHGDEPCGPAALEALLSADLDVERPVKLIVANERALARGVRYVDEDLNRAFPGDPDADTHEGRLAHELLAEIRGCEILSLHSTQSYAAPFALVSELNGYARSICPYLSVEAVVDAGPPEDGRIFDTSSTVIEVEAGYQGSEAAAQNAIQLAQEFLVATDALPGENAVSEHPLFELGRAIQKPPAEDYEVCASNFEPVDQGETCKQVAPAPPVPEKQQWIQSHDYYDFAWDHVNDIFYVSAPDTAYRYDRE